MESKIQKWGNSQGLRLPKPLLEAAHFLVGETVELSLEAGQIVIAARPSLAPEGWSAGDGPISDMSAKGVTGNLLPNQNEVGGRSGEGAARTRGRLN